MIETENMITTVLWRTKTAKQTTAMCRETDVTSGLSSGWTRHISN